MPSLRSSLKKGLINDVYPEEVIELNQHKIHLRKMANPQNFLKKPIVILSGPYHHQEMFDKTLQQLIQEHPVYLVELPGFGDNHFHRDADECDHIALIHYFLDEVGLESCILVAFSLASSIAYQFAAQFTDRVDKLVVFSTCLNFRDSVKNIVSESFELLKEGQREQFAHSMVMTFMNHSKRKNVKAFGAISQHLYQHFYQSPFEQMQFQINKVLHHQAPVKHPTCPTLVVAGEFDHFTTTFEGFQVAENCPKGSLAIVKSSDHFLFEEKNKQVSDCLAHFLDGQDVDTLRGLSVWNKRNFPISSRRIHPRWDVSIPVKVKNEKGEFFSAVMTQLSVEGAEIKIDPQDMNLCAGVGVQLQVPSSENMRDFIIFDRLESKNDPQAHSTYIRGLFYHKNFEEALDTEQWVELMVSGAEKVA